MESEDVDAAFAAVADASDGQIPCSCCDELFCNAKQLHIHQMEHHSLSELSSALITLRGLDLPLMVVTSLQNITYHDQNVFSFKWLEKSILTLVLCVSCLQSETVKMCNSVVDEDSSFLRSIMLESNDKPHNCDSESTITLNSDARMPLVSAVSKHFQKKTEDRFGKSIVLLCLESFFH